MNNCVLHEKSTFLCKERRIKIFKLIQKINVFNSNIKEQKFKYLLMCNLAFRLIDIFIFFL